MAVKKSVKQEVSVQNVFRLWAWILLAWSLYRYFFKLPEWADEFIFKPLVFVAPVVWYVRSKEKLSLETIGLTTRNFFNSVYIGLGFGIVFAIEGMVTHAMKYGKLDVNPIAAFQQYGFFLLLIFIFFFFNWLVSLVHLLFSVIVGISL